MLFIPWPPWLLQQLYYHDQPWLLLVSVALGFGVVLMGGMLLATLGLSHWRAQHLAHRDGYFWCIEVAFVMGLCTMFAALVLRDYGIKT